MVGHQDLHWSCDSIRIFLLSLVKRFYSSSLPVYKWVTVRCWNLVLLRTAIHEFALWILNLTQDMIDVTGRWETLVEDLQMRRSGRFWTASTLRKLEVVVLDSLNTIPGEITFPCPMMELERWLFNVHPGKGSNSSERACNEKTLTQLELEKQLKDLEVALIRTQIRDVQIKLKYCEEQYKENMSRC